MQRRAREQRDELERALHAGSVMEKTLLEPSQVESHQPHLGSAVGLRHGESRTLPKRFLISRVPPASTVEAFVTQTNHFVLEELVASVTVFFFFFALARVTFPAHCGQSSSWTASRSQSRTCN